MIGPVEVVHPELCILLSRRIAKARKSYSSDEIVANEIVAKLQQVDALTSQGQSVVEAEL
jgi:hypothetical protein